MLGRRFDLLGSLRDLVQAITVAEEIVATTPPDHPEHVGRICMLGELLIKRYSRLGDPIDIERGIGIAEEAVTRTPLDDPYRPGLLIFLAKAIGMKYTWPTELPKGTKDEFLNTVLSSIAPGDPLFESITTSETIVFNPYTLLGDVKHLDLAVSLAEEAVTKIPLDHGARAYGLECLGGAMYSRYRRLEGLKDLEQAVKYCEEALISSPANSSTRANVAVKLVEVLLVAYHSLTAEATTGYRSKLLHIYDEVWKSPIFTPMTRIRVARLVAWSFASKALWQESFSLYRCAIGLISAVSPRSLARADQEYRVSQLAKITTEAVSVAFHAEQDASDCMTLLELGRGIIMGLVIDYRSNIKIVRQENSELFDKFSLLRMEIDTPVDTSLPPKSLYTQQGWNYDFIYNEKQERQENAVQELESTIQSIRQIPGFEGFQLPPSPEELMEIATDGPIIIFNSTPFRSDAIIVTKSSINSVPLPRLYYQQTEDNMRKIGTLIHGARSTYRARNESMEEILLWLWEAAVEPVLNEFGLGEVSDSDLPRVWWIGVGILALAPFHAAGDHSHGSTRNTISRAISSYTPTIKALSYAREKKLDLASRQDSHILLISIATTPPKSHSTSCTPQSRPNQATAKPPAPLHNVIKEVETISHVVESKAIVTHLERPSAAQVLKKLPSYHAVHFACHGRSDSTNPSNSHLLLRNEDGPCDYLSVGEISNVNMKQAQIAYLSACGTAENCCNNLADESIYIASAFQLAGFGHVLATQWASNDRACLQVAEDFYASLFGQGAETCDQGHRKVSSSFHHAVKRLRDRIPSQPIKWACFIHTGA